MYKLREDSRKRSIPDRVFSNDYILTADLRPLYEIEILEIYKCVTPFNGMKSEWVIKRERFAEIL